MRSRCANKSIYAILLIGLILLQYKLALPYAGRDDLRPKLPLQINHVDHVSSAAYSADGRTIATGGSDGTIKLWDAQTGETKCTLKTHGGQVNGLAFSPDNKYLVSGGDDGTLRIWNMLTGALELAVPGREPEIIGALELSPDARLLAVGHSATEGLSGSITIWDFRKRTVARTITEDAVDVTALAFSSDNKTIASVSGGTGLKLWNAETGKLVHKLTGHSDAIVSVSFSREGSTLASGSKDGSIKLWNASTGAMLKEIAGEPNVENAVAFSPTEASLAVGNSEVKILDPNSGTVLRTLAKATIAIRAMRFSVDGQTVLGIGVHIDEGSAPADNQVHLWDANTGEFKRRLNGFREGVLSVAFSPKTSNLIVENVDRQIRFWDMQTGRLKKKINLDFPLLCMDFSPYAEILAVGGGPITGPGELSLWDVRTGQLKQKLPGNPSPINSVRFSPDGNVLASGSVDGIIKTWDVKTGNLLKQLSANKLAVRALAFSPDKPILASGGLDSNISLWDLESGNLLHTLKGSMNGIYTSAFSPDGATVAGGNLRGEALLWNVQTGELKQSIKPLSDRVASLAFSAQGKNLVIGNDDGRVTLWSIESGKLLQTLTEHDGGVTSMTFLAPEGRIASGSMDNTVNLFDSKSGKMSAVVYTLRPDQKAGINSSARPESLDDESIIITPEGYYSTSPAIERSLKFRIGTELYPIECFHAVYYRPDLVSKALRGEKMPEAKRVEGPHPPLVGFTSHKNGDTFSGRSLKLTLKAIDDKAIGRVELFVNGVPVKPKQIKLAKIEPVAPGLKIGSRLAPTPHKVARTINAVVYLPSGVATFKLRAVAFDYDGLQSPPEEISVTRNQMP